MARTWNVEVPESPNHRAQAFAAGRSQECALVPKGWHPSRTDLPPNYQTGRRIEHRWKSSTSLLICSSSAQRQILPKEYHNPNAALHERACHGETRELAVGSTASLVAMARGANLDAKAPRDKASGKPYGSDLGECSGNRATGRSRRNRCGGKPSFCIRVRTTLLGRLVPQHGESCSFKNPSRCGRVCLDRARPNGPKWTQLEETSQGPQEVRESEEKETRVNVLLALSKTAAPVYPSINDGLSPSTPTPSE